jgi:hypothetical protein
MSNLEVSDNILVKIKYINSITKSLHNDRIHIIGLISNINVIINSIKENSTISDETIEYIQSIDKYLDEKKLEIEEKKIKIQKLKIDLLIN